MAGVAMTTIGKTWTADESQSSISSVCFCLELPACFISCIGALMAYELLRGYRNRKHYLVGDLFALLSAMTYGLFTG